MIKIEKKKNIDIVNFHNIDRISAINCDSIKTELNQLFDKSNEKIIVNFDNIEFVDSTGFGALLSVFKTAQNKGGEIKLCNLRPEVVKLFKLLHLDNVFDIHSNINNCINAF
jgi:anti-sigma B factor antagonist